jgi:DNA-binding transcriptional MerR regulator
MIEELLRLEELAERCGLRATHVRRLVILGLIDPVEEKRDRFAPEVVLRVQRIVRIHQELGVNYTGVGVILDLLDRIEVLEQRLRLLDRP